MVTHTNGPLTATEGGSIPLTRGEEFIPYSDLTEEICIGWVKDVLGATTVSIIEQNLVHRVNNPPTDSGLPWSTESGSPSEEILTPDEFGQIG